MRSIWNMPDKRKKIWVFHRHSLSGVFSRPSPSYVPVYSHLTLVGWSSPLDYHCSFPFLEIGDSLLSSAGRFRHRGSTRFGLTGLHLIFRIRTLRLMQTPPGLLAVLFVFTCVLQKRIEKGAACFLVTWWPGNTGACWSKQNADACGVGKRDVERRRASRWRDGGG